MTTIKDDGRVEFRFYRPGAEKVRLAGDFSQWASESIEMRPVGNGWWTTSVHLPAGDYRFRYIADGIWYTDFASHGVEVNNLGWNSVLVVPRAEMKLTTDHKPKRARSAA